MHLAKAELRMIRVSAGELINWSHSCGTKGTNLSGERVTSPRAGGDMYVVWWSQIWAGCVSGI